MADTGQKAASTWLQLSLGVWIIGAQVFYFYQFSPAIGSLLRALSPRVWH
jgi:hypothetical protein